MSTSVRIAVSLIFAVGFLLIWFPIACEDVGGIPSWERCISFAGFNVPSIPEDLGIDSMWNVPVYLGLGAGVGWLVWWAQGRLSRM